MARWLSRLERRPVTAEVVGSIPSRVVCGSAEIGRQARLRILCPIGRVGSSPISRIMRKAEKSAFRFFYTLNGCDTPSHIGSHSTTMSARRRISGQRRFLSCFSRNICYTLK